MGQTKCWAVTSFSSCGFGSGFRSIVGIFLSKQEADFYAWEQKRAQDKNSSMYLFSYTSYSVEEVQVLTREKVGKLWDKFAKEKREEIDRAIAENTSHSAEDIARVESLKKEKELLETPAKTY